MKSILFDLDGTLTDSGEGIINCASLALERFGIPVPSREEMGVFIGPPLRDTFQKFGVPSDRLDEAVEIFRSRYIPIGIYENTPYPGVAELLQKLKARGHRLYIATSKPETMATAVLKRFGMYDSFDLVCGATLDGVRDKKSEVIAYLLAQVGNHQDICMVGDTAFDVIGATEHGIPTIGVSWGYGDVSEMVQAGAIAIANTVDELFQLLTA